VDLEQVLWTKVQRPVSRQVEGRARLERRLDTLLAIAATVQAVA
jgi:hypothetical protein